jgi:hypothetical protein
VEKLFRHRAGNYYAIVKGNGKKCRRSLDTSDFNLAKASLPNVVADLRGSANAKKAGSIGEALRAEAEREDPGIKSTTRHYYQQVAASLIETSATLAAKPADKAVNKTTLADLRAWMDAHAKRASRTRYNGAMGSLVQSEAGASRSQGAVRHWTSKDLGEVVRVTSAISFKARSRKAPAAKLFAHSLAASGSFAAQRETMVIAASS